MSSTINQITEQLETRKTNAINAYRELVTLTASDGKSPSLDEIERILRDSDKTIDDFASDERRCRRRNEWREAIGNVPQINSEIAATKAGISAEDEKLEAAKQAHAKAVRPLRLAIGTANDSLLAASAARSELVRTMWPEDAQELKHLEHRCQVAHREATEARESLLALKSRVSSSSPQRNNYGWLSEKEEQAERGRVSKVRPEVFEKAELRVEAANEALNQALKVRDEFSQEALAR
ncbi:hypothetical protein [Rhodopirellula bahusiensis]|uniref:hypothetical protein n=1 Tax=Rhodopirellula bahusiensis TaxID=2014065 RepID=UPI003266CEE6